MRHFEEELEELKDRLLEMSGLVESAVYRSVLAVVESNRELAQEVLTNEAGINQMQIEIDDAATRLLALQQPMATDLRFLTAAIKLNNDLERMGDSAVNIAERGLSLMDQPPVNPSVDIPHLARLTESMVRKSLDAFVKKDADLARSVLASDDPVDDLRDSIYAELIRSMQADPKTVPQCVNLMFVAHNLERIADHATNIAEDVLYLIEGIDVRHHAEAPKRG